VPDKEKKVSDLINDLSSVPNIIGNLGLSIAAAQKAFNLDYLENIERIFGLVRATLGAPAQPDAMVPIIQDMLKAVAPARYQLSETTLAVKLDLAQTLESSASAGLGVGYGAVTLNAAFTIGYSYDYRAAAECHTVIHAIPADQAVFQKLLDRSKELNDKTLELLPKAPIDQALWDQTTKMVEKLTGVKPAAIKPAGGQ
jgi:hypothetical protein